ncbi:thioesterase family protein [Clostridium luticellarii]|uniref:Fluoroacetyl-CoA thioesterase n=1 Tax=Clostridium luticellarii TaxID=1691940 RepID=A0A2T0BD45_9CLOT|nr:thioesterase family protein [Clostridium luticellarii]MCI1944583.1 thioesterase family protein [Clostridium luticellarii]MCI1968082.1 thioesterase family protein [Clostridium luticellarii]MCI1994805.1 thioesterase family protein [Clostridium luticellarii]MCI2039037.1 thioesterase family protein [Clostridium luticellarii]PRR81819.1 Fluoroacetyl-CoA thioesterase [Clostridium luticellarii]
MEFNLREGITSTMEIYITENDTAKKMGSGNLNVFATPAMIALIENTCKNCVDLHLPSGYTTVGIEVNVKHIKPSPVGVKVRCEAVLQKIDRKKLFFKVEAWDNTGKIGEGSHVRYIVNSENFMKKMQ